MVVLVVANFLMYLRAETGEQEQSRSGDKLQARLLREYGKR